MVNNVFYVGYQYFKVVEVVQQQVAVFNINICYLYIELARYVEEFVVILFEFFLVVYFVIFGSEANELVLCMVCIVMGCYDILVMDGVYYGYMVVCIDISVYKFNGKGGSG